MKVKSFFSTYLLFSKEKIAISVHKDDDFKNVYYKETFLDKKKLDIDSLNNFLENNILEIERSLNDFIKNINLILESDDFLKISISLKKNNYEELINKEKLKRLLNEAKNECKKTIDNRKIVHMLIESYFIDKKVYKFFPDNLKCNFFSMDLSFICLSKEYYSQLEQILKNYQVSINKILQFNYVNSFSTQNQKNLFEMSKLLLDGFNENEVLIIPKETKNKGYFERFFNLMS